MGEVDDSLAALAEPARGCLQRVIAAARRIVPDAEEGRSYGMPALKLDGKPLIGVAAAAKHLSIFPFSPEPGADNGTVYSRMFAPGTGI